MPHAMTACVKCDLLSHKTRMRRRHTLNEHNTHARACSKERYPTVQHVDRSLVLRRRAVICSGVCGAVVAEEDKLKRCDTQKLCNKDLVHHGTCVAHFEEGRKYWYKPCKKGSVAVKSRWKWACARRCPGPSGKPWVATDIKCSAPVTAELQCKEVCCIAVRLALVIVQ
jgi:hypothetical protein